jgi:hypothetical protein
VIFSASLRLIYFLILESLLTFYVLVNNHIDMNEWFLEDISRPVQVLLLFSVLRPTDLNPWFEAVSCVSTNQQAIYCWVQLYVVHLCKLEYSVSFPAPNDQYLAMNGIFLVCHHLFLNFSWFLLLFLPWFKIFCRNEDEKKRERGRRCWRHCYQWKRNSVV